MVTRGPVYPTLASATGGWTTPSNGRFGDGVTTSAFGDNMPEIQFTGFNLRIPTNSTILGVVFEIRRYANSASSSGGGDRVMDISIRIIKGGVVSGNNYAKPDVVGQGRWPLIGSQVYVSYGGSTDLWGLSLTPADVNASNFGIEIYAEGNTQDSGEQGFINGVRCTVYYQPAPVSYSDGILDVAYPTKNYIHSVQQFSITIPTGATTATATIDRVNTAQSIITYGGFSGASVGSGPNVTYPRIVFNDATTVSAVRNTSSATGTVTVKGSVIYFSTNAIVSIRRGTIAFGTSDLTATATITSVTPGNSTVIFNGITSAKTTNLNFGETVCSLAVTNSTTVTATRGASGTAMTVSFTVIEWQPAILKSRQQLAVTHTSSNTSDVSTITAVNPASSLLLNAGMNTASTSLANTMAMMQLTAKDGVTFTRTGTGTDSRSYEFSVAEFIQGVLDIVQRGTMTFSSGTSTTATVSAIPTNLGACSQNGVETDASATTFNNIFLNTELTNSTTVTSARGASASLVSGAGYELFSFY